MIVALWAGLGLFAYNVIVTLLTQAVARNRIWLASWMAAACGVVSFGVTALVVEALRGDNLEQKALVFLAIAVANVLGTLVGTEAGAHWMRSARVLSLRK